jgi:hypothetical protein
VTQKPHQTQRLISPEAWLKSACDGLRYPYDRLYQAQTSHGQCLVGLDRHRAHLDWHADSSKHPKLADQYNAGVEQLITALADAAYTPIHAEAEYERIRGIIALRESSKHKTGRLSKWLDKDKTVTAQFRHFPAAPIMFEARNVPDVWMNYYYLRDALYGFNAPIPFWYHAAAPEQHIIGLGMPGERLALLMPLTGF